jgi:hypothetical protein
MNGFCPEGYISMQAAIVRAAAYWFSQRFAALDRAAAPQLETKPDNSVEEMARAFSQPPVITNLRHELRDIANQTVHRLRDSLHQGKLKAYYFGDDGCHWGASRLAETSGCGN